MRYSFPDCLDQLQKNGKILLDRVYTIVDKSLKKCYFDVLFMINDQIFPVHYIGPFSGFSSEAEIKKGHWKYKAYHLLMKEICFDRVHTQKSVPNTYLVQSSLVLNSLKWI